VGCGSRVGNDRYIPPVEAAERAVRAALDNWKQGHPAGPIAGTSPAINVVDAHRVAGQKLEHYTIVGEVTGDGPRCFAVKLKLSNPAADETTRYVVVGIDPLWVFHQTDYDMLAHWEHPMEPEKPIEDEPAEKPGSAEKTE
jgi:hypothetical protein